MVKNYCSFSIVELERMAKGFAISPTGCWEWTRQRNPFGYGRVRVSKPVRRNAFAHRYMYQLVRQQEISPRLQCDHLCRNTSCVNPYHMELVPPKVNTLRGIGPTAANARRQQCPRGHEYNSQNTRPARVCKICKNITQSKWRDANRTHVNENQRRYRATVRTNVKRRVLT